MTVWNGVDRLQRIASEERPWPRRVVDVLNRSKTFAVSLVVSYLGALGLLSFTVAGFLANRIIGFIVLGVCLLILDKAVKRASDS